MLLVLCGCDKDAIGPQQVNQCSSDSIAADPATRVYIINEGNFTWGNASLSVYNTDGQTVSNNAFSTANGRPLGDVAQSITLVGNTAYLVVNNSGKIEVLDGENLEARTTITGLNSPRYLLPLSAKTAYVSDLYANSVSILDRTSNIITGSIPIPGWTETMLRVNNEVFVVGTDANAIYVVDPVSHTLVGSIPVHIEPNSLVLDANGMLWTLCSGGFQEGLPALVEIDPATHTVTRTFEFADLQDTPISLCINAEGNQLMWVNGAVYQQAIAATTLSTTPWWEQEGSNLYRVAINPHNNEVYLSDPGNFVEEGEVLRLSPHGNPIDTIAVGIIPGNILFGT